MLVCPAGTGTPASLMLYQRLQDVTETKVWCVYTGVESTHSTKKDATEGELGQGTEKFSG